MNTLFKPIEQDRILLRGFLASFFVLLITGASMILTYSKLPPLLPLFNQEPWGEARLGTRIEFFIPLGIGILILVVNFLLANFLYNKLPLLSRIVSIISLLISILLLLFIFRTIQLVL